MSDTLVIALSTLGGSFGGAILGSLLTQLLRLRRKRIDNFYNEVDSFRQRIDDLATSIPETMLSLTMELIKLSGKDKKLFIQRNRVAEKELVHAIDTYKNKLWIKPDVIRVKKYIKREPDLIISRWYFPSRKKVGYLDTSLTRIARTKYEINPERKEILFSDALDYTRELQFQVNNFYLALKKIKPLERDDSRTKNSL